tara:strand:+ start:4779 stop:5018 length:240 start_codon:yes stop_codon:yes gene_type:complete
MTNTRGHIASNDDKVEISTDLIVQGRDVLKELDELRDYVLLLPRDMKLEEKYPELKDAYNSYMELYKGLQIARKMMEVE